MRAELPIDNSQAISYCGLMLKSKPGGYICKIALIAGTTLMIAFLAPAAWAAAHAPTYRSDCHPMGG